MVQKKSYKFKQINQDERLEIFGYKRQGFSDRKIGRLLGRNHTSIGREIARNSIDLGRGKTKYNPVTAEKKKNKRRNKAIQTHIKLKKNHNLRNKILSILSDKTKCRGPDEILGRLKLEGRKVVVTSTLYRYIHKYTIDWRKYLRYKKEGYKRKLWKRKKTTTIKNVPKISERTINVCNRRRIGDWEVDTIVSKGHVGGLFTGNDRKSRLVVIKKIKNHKANGMLTTMIETFENYKVKTATSDNGVEFARLEIFGKRLNVKCFTAHPYASYERGTNERSNGLIRRFIPKGSNILEYTNRQIEEIQNNLNNKPRKILGYRTPYEIYNSINTNKIRTA